MENRQLFPTHSSFSKGPIVDTRYACTSRYRVSLFLPRGDPARQRRVHQHLTARRGALWKKWLPVKFSFISLRHVFPASFVRSFHERCACSWLYGKEFTFHTSFNQNQRRRRVAEKNHGWPKNCFKSHGLFKTYQMEKEMMVYLELHEVLAFQIHIWCKEHYSKKLYQGFLQLVLEYEWKMVVQQRNVSCFFESHQKSYMDELLNMYFVWLNVRQLVLHEINVSKIHFWIFLISMLDTCLWVVW